MPHAAFGEIVTPQPLDPRHELFQIRMEGGFAVSRQRDAIHRRTGIRMRAKRFFDFRQQRRRPLQPLAAGIPGHRPTILAIDAVGRADFVAHRQDIDAERVAEAS